MYFCNVLNILPFPLQYGAERLSYGLQGTPEPPPSWGSHPVESRPLSVARPGDFLLMKRMRQNGVMSFQD